MKNLLISDLSRRSKQLSERSHLGFLKFVAPGRYADVAIKMIYTNIRDDEDTLFSVICTNMGKALLKEVKHKQKTSLAVRFGAFVLESFENLDLVSVRLKTYPKYNIYVIDVINARELRRLFRLTAEHEIDNFPSIVPEEDWEHGMSHGPLVKTNSTINKSLTANEYPYVFETINKSQRIGRRVNREVLNVADWALNNTEEAFNDIWHLHGQAKRTKWREADTIIDIAKRFRNNTFYYRYFFDFRY